MSAVDLDMAAEFADRRAKAVEKAEAALRKAEERHDEAMKEYEAEVARHEERGDGYFPASYHVKRAEAVRSSKWLRVKRSALITAKAEASAPTLGGES
ncbi:hypothetical protein [Microbacterium enclense]|uniref:hypothetical protein n=1 Tax=Microbacterium enclense TaxID=993073 RepID=UPI003421DAA4